MKKLILIAILASSFSCQSVGTRTDNDSFAKDDKQMSDFDRCVEEGGRVLKTYPMQCINSNGVRFIQETTNS